MKINNKNEWVLKTIYKKCKNIPIKNNYICLKLTKSHHKILIYNKKIKQSEVDLLKMKMTIKIEIITLKFRIIKIIILIEKIKTTIKIIA